MIKRGLIFLIIACLSFALLACSVGFRKEGRSTIIDEKTFIDDVGNTFTVDGTYTKIVSLYSAHTENICVLGKEESLIGVNSTSIYPPSVAFLPVYDYKADAEPLVAAFPDVVLSRPFIDRNYPDYIRALKSAGITVISLYPETADDFEKYITILAMIVGASEKVEDLFFDYYLRLDEIAQKTANVANKKTVFFESTKTDYRTVTPDSNPAKAIETAGGINIASDVKPMKRGTTIASFGIEKLMMNADDIDVYVSQRGAMNSGGSMVSILQREGFSAIKAVKDGRILELNEKIISSPTFRYYKGVNEIARTLYPKIMDDINGYRSDNLMTRQDYAIITVKLNHTPIFLPSSSHYYEKQHHSHTYGLFSDVNWDEENFDYIETAVANSFIFGYEDENETAYFDKNALVTRQDVAFTLYMMGDYQSKDESNEILDLDRCDNAKIVQKIVDNKLMVLKDGYFNPTKPVSYNFVIDTLSEVLR
jgi:iron complex transport system substrate-binding protein